MSFGCMVKNEKALSQIRALLKAEGIDFNDKEAALKSISETVMPTKLKIIYLAELDNETNTRPSKPVPKLKRCRTGA